MTVKRCSEDKIMISGWSKPIPALKLRSKARLVVVGADGWRALLEIEINTEDMMMAAIMVMIDDQQGYRELGWPITWSRISISSFLVGKISRIPDRP